MQNTYCYYSSRRLHRPRRRGVLWLVLLLFWSVIIGVGTSMFWQQHDESYTDTHSSNAVPALAHRDAGFTATGLFYSRTPKLAPTLSGDKPKVLIYHTHACEAYTQTEQYSYKEQGQWRTLDHERSVIKVGALLAKLLTEVYGVSVVHDTTNHEPPKLSTAYERSELTMAEYAKEYPSIVLFIDLHRDAYTVTDEPTTDFATVFGEELARIMFVVGTGDNYDEKPFYRQNLELAKLVTGYLERIEPRLVRPVRVKSGRYNQHIANRCLLVEVGHNANTLEQALASMPYLAEAIVLAMDAMENSKTPLELWVPRGSE